MTKSKYESREAQLQATMRELDEQITNLESEKRQWEDQRTVFEAEKRAWEDGQEEAKAKLSSLQESCQELEKKRLQEQTSLEDAIEKRIAAMSLAEKISVDSTKVQDVLDFEGKGPGRFRINNLGVVLDEVGNSGPDQRIIIRCINTETPEKLVAKGARGTVDGIHHEHMVSGLEISQHGVNMRLHRVENA